MKYGITNFKDFKNLNYETATLFVKQNWMKMVIIIFILFVLLKKDISLNLNLQASGSSAFPSSIIETQFSNFKNESTAIYPEPAEPTKTSIKQPPKTTSSNLSVLPYFEPEHKILQETEVKPPVTPKDNRANHYANLTFIFSPDYAKRHNIDREIVIARQETVYGYVKRYSDIAISEMNKYGIPASITLAQGILESDAGESRLARKNNNHFGIKCFSKKCRKGHCANFTDDTHKDFFRKYNSVWESYRGHSVFLQGKRYRHLKNLGTKDYKNWADGLRKAGYATDRKYAEKLIKIIETLELHKLDE